MQYAKGNFPRTQYGGTDFINKSSIAPGTVSSPIGSISEALPERSFQSSLGIDTAANPLPFETQLGLSIGQAPEVFADTAIPKTANAMNVFSQYKILKEKYPNASDQELWEKYQEEQKEQWKGLLQ